MKPYVALALLAANSLPHFRIQEPTPFTNGFVGRGRYRAWGENDWRAKAKRVARRRRLRKANKNPRT